MACVLSVRKSEQNESSVSFLDIIACAFGAIVLLVLILPVEDLGILADAPPVAEDYDLLVLEEAALQQAIEILAEEITANRKILASIGVSSSESAEDTASTSQVIAATAAELQRVKANVARTRVSTQRLQSETVKPTPFSRDEYAGIPVDSEYVIFVIDTSGSMEQLWDKVVSEVTGVLELYPKMKGFQIISDEGGYMFKNQRKQWLQDTPKQRTAAIRKLRNWRSNSNSSPAEGIRRALRDLYDPKNKTAMFIFGDDFATSDDLNSYIEDIDRIVAATGVQEGTFRLHAIGFENTPHLAMSPVRFSVLMRELTYRHGGAFLALPLLERQITPAEQ